MSSMTLGQAVHLYRGDCPDALQPESRDTECEACREEDALRAHLLSQEAEIERLQSRLAAADALLREALPEVFSNVGYMALHDVKDGSMESSAAVAKRIDAHLSENGQ